MASDANSVEHLRVQLQESQRQQWQTNDALSQVPVDLFEMYLCFEIRPCCLWPPRQNISKHWVYLRSMMKHITKLDTLFQFPRALEKLCNVEEGRI